MATRLIGMDRGPASPTEDLIDRAKLWRPPYRHAAVAICANRVDGFNIDIGRIIYALAVAQQVSILFMRANCDADRVGWDAVHSDILAVLSEMIAKAGGDDRWDTAWFKVKSEMVDYLVSTEDVDLLVAERSQMPEIEKWFDRRISRGHRPYDVLLRPSYESDVDIGPLGSRPPYRLASIGGTFNAMHVGHEAYLALAFTLADRVHIYLSDDEFAQRRKRYRPRPYRYRRRSLRELLQRWECFSRADLEALSQITEVRRFVETESCLDLVVSDYGYLKWFIEWCDRRGDHNLPDYDILCKARTAVHGTEVTSGLIASMEMEMDEKTEQFLLFE